MCFLRQCGVIWWSLPYERRRRMKIYVAAAAALPSASSRKPQTHEEKKRRWRCSWFELLARGAALSARSNKPAPHTLGHLLPGGAPVHCTSFRIHLRLLFIVALLTSLQGGDNRLQEEQRCLLCWEAMGRATVSDRTWNSATVEQTGERKKTMRSEVFPHPSCFHHVHKRIKTLQSYQSYEGSRKELSNSWQSWIADGDFQAFHADVHSWTSHLPCGHVVKRLTWHITHFAMC